MRQFLTSEKKILREKIQSQCSINQGFPGSSVGKESACNAGDPGSIPGLGRSPGEGNGNPLQNSCLENPTEEPGGLYSPWGRKRGGHNLATKQQEQQN